MRQHNGNIASLRLVSSFLNTSSQPQANKCSQNNCPKNLYYFFMHVCMYLNKRLSCCKHQNIYYMTGHTAFIDNSCKGDSIMGRKDQQSRPFTPRRSHVRPVLSQSPDDISEGSSIMKGACFGLETSLITLDYPSSMVQG